MKKLVFLIVMLEMSCIGIPNSPIYTLDKNLPDSIPTVFAQGTVSMNNRFETGLTISPDGTSLAFGVVHESDEEQTSIYLMNYTNGKWNVPNKDFLLNNRNAFFPMFGPDGKEFYFVKSTDNTETDIWVADYIGNRAIKSRRLNSSINSLAREAGHGKSSNGSFYFTSNRVDKHHCCGDIFRSKINNKGTVSPVYKLNELNTDSDEESIFVSKNEDYIIVQSWKNEFKSKHDLYISYRNKDGDWLVPERLGGPINSKEIEQRPFVSPDNKYLFFGRMSTTHKNNEESYESDIFWVNTKSIFGPYPYNIPTNIEISYNKPFNIQLPNDIFKDVDNKTLTYKVSLADKEKMPEWIDFDPETLILSGVWRDNALKFIKIYASDDYKNQRFVRVPLTIL